MIKKYSGVVVPLITPYNEKNSLDEAAVTSICKNCASHDVSVLILGTTGESPSVSTRESRRMVKVTANAIKRTTKIYACLTGNCVEENIENAKAYIEAGADVIVSVLPCYYTLSSSEMYAYYEKLADAIDFPLMIYNIPTTTNISIPMEIVEKLSKHPNILGFKDSERDEARIATGVKMFRDREDFSYFVGYAALCASALRMGADGIIPSTGNFVPGMFKQLYDYSVSGMWEEAERLQKETNEIAQIYQAGRSLGESLQALKVMMSEIFQLNPVAIPPLSELSMEEQNKILMETRKILEKYNLHYEKKASHWNNHG
jgi:dihydrodipicolinate synthase/N-acetylneuraminate lyase